MTDRSWILHDHARDLIGRAIYRDDWIGGLTAEEIELLNSEYGPKRWPRPNGASGYFNVINPCPPGQREKLDAALGRDQRMIMQLSTVLEWLDQNGLGALQKGYSKQVLDAAIATIRSPSPSQDRPLGAGKRGPVRGTIARYEEDDRSKFPQMRHLIAQGLSPTAAAFQLADQLKGDNTTLESRATRLRKLFQAEDR